MPSRFRRLRKSRLIRALKWLFTRPFFRAVIITVIVLNWGYGQLVPHIVSIPLALWERVGVRVNSRRLPHPFMLYSTSDGG
jgi:hypothetical protein